MKPVLAAATLLSLAACAQPEPPTVIVSSVSASQREACTAAAAEARGVPMALVQTTSATATETGPIVSLSVAGVSGSCKLDELGNVQSVTFP